MSSTLFRRVAAVSLTAALAATPARAVDKTWNHGGSGSATNPAYWTPYGVPGASDTTILPNIGQSYTVTTDAIWSIDDLEIRQQRQWDAPVGQRDGRGQRQHVFQFADSWIRNDQRQPDRQHRADPRRGGVLNIGMGDNDHDNGTLSAATGGTLHVRNASNITNRATIDLQGGTLWGYQYYTYNLINDDSASQITGRGTIEPGMDVSGTLSANSNGNTLTVSGAITVLAGGTAKAESGGTLNLAGNVANRCEIKAIGGAVTATGTILAASDATGDFSATSGQHDAP